MKKRLKNILIFLLLVASLFLFVPNVNSECSWQENVDKMQFYGIVEAKFLDTNNHSIPVIRIRSLATTKLDTLELFGDKSGAYDLISISDTITKRTDSSEIYKVSKGEQKLIAIVDFGCEQE